MPEEPEAERNAKTEEVRMANRGPERKTKVEAEHEPMFFSAASFSFFSVASFFFSAASMQ